MSKVVKFLSAGVTGGQLVKSTSKIKEYGLEEDVIRLYTQGYKSSRIAKEVNKILAERTDRPEYLEITPQNIVTYIETAQKALGESDPHELVAVVKQVSDITGRLPQLLLTLEDELDKLRVSDGPVPDSKQQFFIQLIEKIQETMRLGATLRGMIQPQVSVAIFNNLSNSVERLAAKVAESPKLDEIAKTEVLNLITDELLNDNLLKTVQGQVVEVPKDKEPKA